MADNFSLFGPQPQTQRQTIFDTPATLSEYLSAQREASFETSYTRLLEQYIRQPEGGRLLSKQEVLEANKRIGIDVDVPDEGIDYNTYRFNAQRQLKLKELNNVIARKPDGVVSSMLGIGAMLGPQIVDPIGVTTAFVPVVGPARYARLVGSAGGVGGRTATRFGLGAAEGAVATAALEPANYYLANALGDDYDGYDSFMNVAFGAGFGGALGAGGGLMSDAWGAGFRGVASAVPREEQGKILQAAAQILMRDGSVDLDGILNAATRTKLLYNLNEVATIPGLRKEIETNGPFNFSDLKAKQEYLKDKPDLQARIADLEIRLAGLQSAPANIYERALNDYNDVNNFEVRTPDDVVLAVRKKEALEKKYGPEFKKEADDYNAYVAKRERLESEQLDARQKKNLQKQIAELEVKYDGRLKKAYEEKRARNLQGDEEYLRIQNELNQINAEQALGVQMKRMELEDRAYRDYEKAKMDFATQYNDGPMKKIMAEVDQFDRELRDMVDEDVAILDEDIAELSVMSKEFEDRTGIKFDEIDDADFDVGNVLKSMKNYMDCIRR